MIHKALGHFALQVIMHITLPGTKMLKLLIKITSGEKLSRFFFNVIVFVKIKGCAGIFLHFPV